MIRPVTSLRAQAAAMAAALRRWRERIRDRRALIALSDRALHDLGIGRAEARAEHGKPFWRD